MLLDADPLRIDAVHQRLLGGALGPAIVPTYSFVSLTEVSEYVPTVEQYGQRLVEEGETLDSPGVSGQAEGLRRARSDDAHAAAHARFAALAEHLLLSNEQEAQGGRELVSACLSRNATS